MRLSEIGITSHVGARALKFNDILRRHIISHCNAPDGEGSSGKRRGRHEHAESLVPADILELVLRPTHIPHRKDTAERPRVGLLNTKAMYAYAFAIAITELSLTHIVTFDTSATSPSPGQNVTDEPLWDLNPPNPLPIIIRATDGHSQSKDKTKNKNKVKLSTLVQPDDLEAFFTRYAEVCKTSMQSLKKRDRKKAKSKKKGKKPNPEEKK